MSVPDEQVSLDLSQAVPTLSTYVLCPHCRISPHQDSVGSVVIHLNDQCGWSRERIADWLDSLNVDLTVNPTRTSKQLIYVSPAYVKGMLEATAKAAVEVNEFTQYASKMFEVIVNNKHLQKLMVDKGEIECKQSES